MHNLSTGVEVRSDGAGLAAIQGNRIGHNGVIAQPNLGIAVHLFGTNWPVGGVDQGSVNRIFHTDGGGVVPAAGGNRFPILGNAISDDLSAGGLAIDYRNNGVTPNDPGDAGTGINDIQNFPLLQAGASPGAVPFTLDSKANTSFRIEFFSVVQCDPSGHGEADLFLGAMQVTSNPQGQVSDSYSGPTGSGLISATATRLINAEPASTSEMSACVQLAGTADPIFDDSFELVVN